MAKVGRLAKELMMQELTDALKERPNFFITNVGALQAEDTNRLRKRLRGLDARLLVMKRRLGARGLTGASLDGETTALLTGSIGLVLPREDVVEIAKLVVEFAKSSQEKFSVRGGWIDGQLLSQQRVEELAALPSKLVLIAQLIAAIEGPMSNVVFTLERVLGDVAWVLEEASKSAKVTQPAAAQPAPAATSETPAAPEAQPPSAETGPAV